MTISLTVSAEVIDRVGLQEAAEFQARVTTFECVECGTAGDVRTGRAVVVLRASPGLSHLGVAHHRCADSQVREYEQGDLALAASTDLIPRAIALPGVHGIRPALLLAYEEQITITADGVPYDVTSLLVAEGLHRLPSLGKVPPASPGWSIHLGPHGDLRVNSPDRPFLTAGEVLAPPAWRALVEPVGKVALFVGSLRRDVLYAEHAPLGAYGQAMKAGSLVAGTVAILLPQARGLG
ncbi:hypothetical protein [Streptomyces sp. MJM1172]|uniref:hypothetical protein n=1 Tax=Streptomyces sp. MJM1172 TaxID=1703926 RepID=UPI00093DFEDC|nr:hypothetical protein [Streptomyces sp. MJM1172]OKI50358.1 hypothetical protein AMK15_32945 [Streptomyces sp. MJM1172]